MSVQTDETFDFFSFDSFDFVFVQTFDFSFICFIFVFVTDFSFDDFFDDSDDDFEGVFFDEAVFFDVDFDDDLLAVIDSKHLS